MKSNRDTEKETETYHIHAGTVPLVVSNDNKAAEAHEETPIFVAYFLSI
jgi:hypothetical protein